MSILASLHSVKDNAVGQLDSGISTSSLSIVLGGGEGALFPQPINGAATSLGSSTTLNDTGIGASGIAIGDRIENVTDGSAAWVRTVDTNSITTSPLMGGSDDTWESADVWYANRFKVTLNAKDADEVITSYEKVLISDRSTDTLTVRVLGDRGIGDTSPTAFSASDYCELFVEQTTYDDVLTELYNQSDRLETQVAGIGKEIMLTAGGALSSTTDGAPIGQVEYTTNDIDVAIATVGAAEDKSIQWSFPTPSDWNGSTIRANIHWIPDSTNGGDARFGIKAVAIGDSDPMDATWGTEIFVVDTASGTADDLMISGNLDFVPGGSGSGGDTIVIKLQRNGSNGADTFTGNAGILGVRLTYNV